MALSTRMIFLRRLRSPFILKRKEKLLKLFAQGMRKSSKTAIMFLTWEDFMTKKRTDLTIIKLTVRASVTMALNTLLLAWCGKNSGDNGVNLVELKREVIPYFIQYAFNAFRPGWKDVSEKALFVGFLECVQMAKNILTREIGRARDITEAQKIIFTIYRNAENKKIIVLDKKYPWEELMQNYPEPIFVVYPRIDNSWGVEGVAASKFSVEKRKKFPDTWAGLRNGELQEISKVPDALFCHRGLFMAVAKSKEGAVKLAQIALES